MTLSDLVSLSVIGGSLADFCLKRAGRSSCRHRTGSLSLNTCPLLFPEHTGQTCEHEQFGKGKGCIKDVNWELGGILRVTLDRKTPLFHALSNQRTGCERINARAKELGIERPSVRNGRSVANLKTRMYVIVNGRV
jgi:hypothetical protein